jgi:hypothetical protein
MNRHQGYSAAMASIVAPRHILPQQGQKTMTIVLDGRALEDGVAFKTSLLGPPSGSRSRGDGYAWGREPPGRAAAAPREPR